MRVERRSWRWAAAFLSLVLACCAVAARARSSAPAGGFWVPAAGRDGSRPALVLPDLAGVPPALSGIRSEHRLIQRATAGSRFAATAMEPGRGPVGGSTEGWWRTSGSTLPPATVVLACPRGRSPPGCSV